MYGLGELFIKGAFSNDLNFLFLLHVTQLSGARAAISTPGGLHFSLPIVGSAS